MESLDNAWFFGIAGGILSGLIVAFISRSLFSRRDNKEYAQKLQQKLKIFKKVTRTNKQLFIALISANGVKKNKYSDELISGIATLDDLFQDI